MTATSSLNPEMSEVQTSDLASPCGLQGNAQRFRKKPVVIDAVRVERRMDILSPDWLYAAVESNTVTLHNMGKWSSGDAFCLINTLEGVMKAPEGDWIIRGVKGELYPCKPDIFAATYEPADSAPTVSREATPASSSPDEKQDAAALQVPAGWVLVPVEPTPEMVGAMAVVDASGSINGIRTVGMAGAVEAYEAMLAARPAAGAQGEK